MHHLGLWFEPEMVSPNSDLYRAHPDWCLHVPESYGLFGGDELMYGGITIPDLEGDYQSITWILKAN